MVNPTAAPSAVEKNHHYLWRFWKDMPKAGHVAIFDRTWYGRVMVERIEGFCTKEEWQRAYKEINDMEAHLAHSGAIVLKFWMHIDKDEQERRFKERMENPEKQWKITDEDWRNREKWDQYEEAVNEMVIRTSTSYAPWILSLIHISIIIDSGNKMQMMERALCGLSVVMNENREEPLNGSKEYYTGFNRRQDYYPERL